MRNEKHRATSSRLFSIPNDWILTKLGACVEIRGSKRLSFKDKKIPFIPMELIPTESVYVKYELKKPQEIKSFTYCEAGDLLLAKITPSLENGKQGIVPQDIPNGFALATTEVFPLQSKKEKILNLFLFYLLKTPRFRNVLITSMIGTTGRQRASKEALLSLPIPLPPLSEQKKIAEILSTVDEAIEVTDKEIEKAESLKRGLMQELLTKAIGHSRFKKTEVGTIPEEWEVVRVEKIFDVYGGTTPSTNNPSFWDGEILWVTPTDITKLGNRIYLNDTERKISEEGLKKSNLKLLEPFTILLTTRATIGYAALSPKQLTINQGMTAFIPLKKDLINPVFYIYWFSKIRDFLLQLGGGSTFKEVSRTTLKKLYVPLPPLPEQKKIAEILSSVDDFIESLRARREKLVKLKQGLMEDLLTGKRRVKIDAEDT